jgi:hypothetical protein
VKTPAKTLRSAESSSSAETPSKLASNISSTGEKFSTTTPLSATPGGRSHRILPTPIFAVQTTRKLSFKDAGTESLQVRHSNRVIFINICVHKAVESYPPEIEYVISDEIFNYKTTAIDDADGNEVQSTVDITTDPNIGETTNSKEHIFEIYHVIIRPDLLGLNALNEDEDRCLQVSSPC